MRLHVTMGIPASGKSTIAANIPGLFISTDAIREDHTIHRAQWLDELATTVAHHLATGDVVIDPCAVQQPARLRWLATAQAAGAQAHLHVVHCAPATALHRNQTRQHRVPPRAMRKYIDAWPTALAQIEDEPWDSISHHDSTAETHATRATTSRKW